MVSAGPPVCYRIYIGRASDITTCGRQTVVGGATNQRSLVAHDVISASGGGGAMMSTIT